MLCIIFTKKRLLAGIKTDIPQLLRIGETFHISYEGRAKHEVLQSHLQEITQSYLEILKESGQEVKSPILTSLAYPVDFENKDGEKNQILNVLKNAASPHSYEPIHSENLVLSFLHGLKNQEEITSKNCIVLEAVDDHLNLCYHLHSEGENVDIKEFGALALHTDEQFQYTSFRNIGYSKGNEQLLNELLKEFSEAGLTVDVKGQTDLALQLMEPNQNERYLYSLSKNTKNITIQAEIELSRDRFAELMSTNKELLATPLGQHNLQEKEIFKVVLLGNYLSNPFITSYLKDSLHLTDKLISLEGEGEYDEFATIVQGLDFRTGEVIHAEEVRQQEEEKKKMEEEKRAKIEAELKVKDSREFLLEELQEQCVDPSKQEHYEEMFVARGIKLGIPEVVIKWNISEVLSRIALQKEGETVGLSSNGAGKESKQEDSSTDNSASVKEETTTSKEPVQSAPVKKETPSSNGTNGHSSHKEEPVTKPETTVEKSEPAPTPIFSAKQTESPQVATIVAPPKVETQTAEKVEIEKKEETKGDAPKEVKEEVKVVETAKKEENKKEEKAPEKKKEKEKKDSPQAESKPSGSDKSSKKKEAQGKAKISLNDIFVIKGSLPDAEFSSKKVTFHSDQELKVVRLLSVKEMKDAEKLANFNKLYKKELNYFEEMSELSESKEGLYYYRPFIERNTLKDHIVKLGLDKKKNLEDLSSSDLKFILQIFKEVKELEVSHANLTEENILILAKRKWNLQKNMEIKFIGFTSKDVDTKEMIEQTHHIFSNLMGKEIYQIFRQKFQL